MVDVDGLDSRSGAALVFPIAACVERAALADTRAESSRRIGKGYGEGDQN